MALNIRTNPYITTQSVSHTANDWGSISFQIQGVAFALSGVSGISYGESAPPVKIAGSGGTIVAKGYPTKEVTGEITMLLSEMDNLIDDVFALFPTLKSPINIAPFTLTIERRRYDGTLYKDMLYGCTFGSYEKTNSEGDTSAEATFDLTPIGIEWNVLMGSEN